MAEGYTVDQWLQHWLLQQEKKNLKKVTIASYRNIVSKHLIPAFQGIPMEKLSALEIEKVYAEWKKQGMPFNTVNTIHIAFRRSLQDACRDGIIASNPAKACQMKLARQEELLPNAKQCYHYLNTAKQFEEYRMLYLALTTDLSQEKIFSLRWVNFDTAHKQIIVGNCVHKLNDRSIELLKQQHQLTGNWEWIFLHPKTKRIYNRAQFYYLHIKVLRKAELPQIAFTLLRKKLQEVEL